jgi:hypothetical protein
MSPYLAAIAAIVTPAILILACGNLVTSTLSRLARVVDRSRVLMTRLEESFEAHDDRALKTYAAWLRRDRARVELAERALRFFYTAIAFFVTACLAIAADRIFRDNAALFALGLTVVGATSLLGGTACLVLETNYAIGSLREEIDFTLQHPEERQALGPESSHTKRLLDRLTGGLRHHPPAEAE